MFTTTAEERAAVGSAQVDCRARLEIQDPDGNWVDVSLDLSTPDWLNSVTISDSIDSNSMAFAAELLRDTAGLSLAPQLESSPLNVDAQSDYAPMLDIHRMWRLSVLVVSHGTIVGNIAIRPVLAGTGTVSSAGHLSVVFVLAGTGTVS